MRIWWSVILAVAGTLATLIILNIQIALSPLPEIVAARKSITAALKASSDKYAYSSLQKAQELYDSAMINWKRENRRIFFLRNFETARSFAEEAERMAWSSMEKTRELETELKTNLSRQIDYLKEHLTQYDVMYGNVPLKDQLINDFAQARLLLGEGVQAFIKNDYLQAKQKLDSAELLISKVATYSRKTLEGYFDDHATWVKWVNKTISESRRQKKPCIIVDKYARTCFLYRNGQLKKSYPVELGPNWIGDKLHQGDKSTPEGIYRVLNKKSGADTQYFKALLLDYPNEDDKLRFAANKKNGHINPEVSIGGLIEIHGHGGKGIDWTDGCIALEDNDMTQLFTESKEGTMVTIVGSRIAFKDLFKSN